MKKKTVDTKKNKKGLELTFNHTILDSNKKQKRKTLLADLSFVMPNISTTKDYKKIVKIKKEKKRIRIKHFQKMKMKA